MDRTWINEVAAHANERVRVSGWLHHTRRLSRVTFLVVRDRTGLLQVVITDPSQQDAVAHISHDSVIDVVGTAAAQAQAPGGVEIHDPTVDVVVAASLEPAIELYSPAIRAQLPTLLDTAASSLRHPRRRAAFEISAAAVAGFRAALDSDGFTEIQTPKIVAAATESGANVFALDYFGTTAYLAQSPQFFKQTMVGVFERVYEVGPVFRAEPHDTQRHLSEYVSLDAEMGFIEDHTTVMAQLTRTLDSMLAAIAHRCSAALTLLELQLPEVPREIPVVAFDEAQRMIAAATGENLEGEPDLAPSHEQWLGEWAHRTHSSEFLFVSGYPMVKRPFYTHPDPARPEFSNSFDLLFRGLELVTGGQRLHRHEEYLAALAARGMDPSPFAGYLSAFQHGMPPHGGFAIGLERLVARLTGTANIREVTLFPRDLHRLSP